MTKELVQSILATGEPHYSQRNSIWYL